MARPSHSWTLPSQHLAIREGDEAPQTTLLLPETAERLVEGLRRHGPQDVGSEGWMSQHQALQRLNMQAHASARANADEFVLEALLTFEKVELLVHELLVIEAWKEQALPLVVPALTKGPASMRCYFVLYHEAVLCNLLETLLYHDYGVAALGDLSVELVDYCARKLTRLNGRFGLEGPLSAGMNGTEASGGDLAARAEARAAVAADVELDAQAQTVELSVCLSALRLARFLAEHLEKLPLAAFTRLLETHDVLMLTLPLLDNPPWTRRRREAPQQENVVPAQDATEGKAKKKAKKKRGKFVWEKLDPENHWQRVDPADLLTLTPLEINAWLVVYFLTCSQEVRKSYHLNTFRKNSLLRVRKFINDMVLDQLPVLADVQRLMDELAVVDVPEPSGLDASGLMMQQVARERESLISGTDWEAVASGALQNALSAAAGASDLAKLAEMYTGDEVLDFLEPRPAGEDDASPTQEELVEKIVREAEAKTKADMEAKAASRGATPATPCAQAEGPDDVSTHQPREVADALQAEVDATVGSEAPKVDATEVDGKAALGVSGPSGAELPAAPIGGPSVADLDDLWAEAVSGAAARDEATVEGVDEEIDLTNPEALD